MTDEATRAPRAVGLYWIARYGGEEIEPDVYTWVVQWAYWSGNVWVQDSGYDYDFEDSDQIVVLSGPLEPPPAPPPQRMWEPHLTKKRWYEVYHREMVAGAPFGNDAAAMATADREVPNYRGGPK
jgi:hypothetical protein